MINARSLQKHIWQVLQGPGALTKQRSVTTNEVIARSMLDYVCLVDGVVAELATVNMGVVNIFSAQIKNTFSGWLVFRTGEVHCLPGRGHANH